MTGTDLSTFTQFSGVREEAPAWVECGDCEEGRIHACYGDRCTMPIETDRFLDIQCTDEQCPTCQGKGGKWMGGIEFDPMSERGGERLYRMKGVGRVTKSTILTREHGVCSWCEGIKTEYCEPCNGIGYLGEDPHNITMCEICDGEAEVDCSKCLKDADGKPSGAEPDTASDWEVKG